jgi:hypothetical protein
VSKSLRLPFDRFQRLRLAAEAVERLWGGPPSGRILDVGGGLAALLPGQQLVELCNGPGRGPASSSVRARPLELPFADGSFDTVVAVETLQQQPAQQRTDLLRELWRVSRGYLVLVGPFDGPRLRHAEVILRRFLKEKLASGDAELEAHRALGLPSREQCAGLLAEFGAQTACVAQGDLEGWFLQRSLESYLLHDPDLARLAESVFEFLNSNLYAGPRGSESYRQCLVAARPGLSLAGLNQAWPVQLAPRGVAEGLSELLKALIGFDLDRRRWRTQRAAGVLPTAAPESEARPADPGRRIEQLEIELAYMGERHGEEQSARRAIEAELERQRCLLREREERLAELEPLARRLAELEPRLAELTRRTGKLEPEIKAESVRAQQLGAELEFVREREAEERSARQAIEADFKQHRECLRQSEQQRGRAEQARAEAEAARSEAERRAAAVSSELAGARVELKRVRELIGSERAQVEQARREAAEGASRTLDTKHKEELAAMRGQAAALAAARDGAVSRAAASEAELVRLGAERERLEVRCVQAEQERDRLAAELASQAEELRRLEEQLRLQGTRCQQLEQRASAAAEQERSWDQEREGFNQSMGEVLADLQRHREVLVELRGDRERMRLVIAGLERELATQRGLLDGLARERDPAAGRDASRPADPGRLAG